MSSQSRSVALVSPAKINLTLAILGQREDGFHDLQSIVAQTEFGDDLVIEWSEEGEPAGDRVLTEGAEIPGDDNSVMAAFRVFRATTSFEKGAFTARLKKRIPIGAGLGGGSSNAAIALKAMADLLPDISVGCDLFAMAAEIGSDCPLFLSDRPVLMEGRGERITALDDELADRLRGRSAILFKPRFPINTAEAYKRLAQGRFYSPVSESEEAISAWKRSTDNLPVPINDFQRLLGEWMPTIPIVLERIRSHHGMDARLSGSGSACFAFPEGIPSAKSRISEEMERAWGKGSWIEEIRLK